jgi:hypothetical protein
MTLSRPHPSSSSKRKERAQLSCQFCRTKKYSYPFPVIFTISYLLTFDRLKCDRAQPCGNCVRRGLASSCQFTRSAAEPPQRSVSIPSEAEQMRNRIQELEQLLISLRSFGASSRPDAEQNEDSHSSLGYEQTTLLTPLSRDDHSLSESSDKICNAVGRMTIVNQQTVYVSDSHWSAILEKVSNIRSMTNR